MFFGNFIRVAMLLAALPATGEVPPAARQQFEAGRYAEAVQTLQAALGQDSKNAALHHWLGRSYFEMRDFDKAVTHAERAAALDSQNSEIRQWLGRAYGRKAERAGWFSGFSLARKTRSEFEEAVRLNPRNFSAQRDLIEFYLEAPGVVGGGKDKARRQAEAVAALDAAEGHVAMAAYWEREKKHDRAAAECQKVLELKPARVEPYLEIAAYYTRREDPGRIQEAVRVAAAVAPKDPRLNYYRAVARVVAGMELEEAERLLKAYLASVPDRSDYPSHPAAHEWLGRLYERQGKRDEAAAEFRAGLKIQPNRKSAREALEKLGQRP